MPIFLMVIFLVPYFFKYHDNPYVKGFVTGATSAAIGSITGAGIIIRMGVITDWPTIIMAAIVLLLVALTRIPGYLLVVATGIAGIFLYR